MPATSEKQRRMMGAELGRLRAGKKTRTGMTEAQLEEYASKPVSSDDHKRTRSHAKGAAWLRRHGGYS